MRAFAAAVMAAQLALFAPLSLAAPVAYDEFVSGDLSPVGQPATTLALDTGVNTIKGTMTFIDLVHADGSQEFVIDMDQVVLTLPLGLALYKASVETAFTDVTGNTRTFEWEWYLVYNNFSQQVMTCYGLLSAVSCPTVSPSGGSLWDGYPYTDSSLYISYGGGMQAVDWGRDFGGSFSYTLSLEVAPVPEPEVAAMMLAGLGLLARRTRMGGRAPAHARHPSVSA
jgi:hypothetical protein